MELKRNFENVSRDMAPSHGLPFCFRSTTGPLPCLQLKILHIQLTDSHKNLQGRYSVLYDERVGDSS